MLQLRHHSVRDVLVALAREAEHHAIPEQVVTCAAASSLALSSTPSEESPVTLLRICSASLEKNAVVMLSAVKHALPHATCSSHHSLCLAGAGQWRVVQQSEGVVQLSDGGLPV